MSEQRHITKKELNSFRIVPAGGAGRLDTYRVYVEYSDGCEVSFAQHRSVTVYDIIEHHRHAHLLLTTSKETK